MKKTLLLVFIHGFKGGDDTFADFPNHFRTLISNSLPKLNVLSVTYPKYETRGDLKECVARFKEWLQNKVIDLEVAARTPSPTVDPSVRVILVGHSMGGIVAAETLLSIARDQPIPPNSSATPPPNIGNNTTTSTSNPGSRNASTANLSVPQETTRSSSAPPDSQTADASTPKPTTSSTPDSATTFLFPYIQAILAFDTPYLGIHPGVVAHGAESHYNTASAAWNAYNQASRFFGGAESGTNASQGAAAAVNASKALPDAQTGKWGNWGKYAMFAGGAAAVAAAGAGAWMGRQQLSAGWTWVGSHLEFVGCLARGAELASRVDNVVRLSESHGIGFADFYTCLGREAKRETYYAGQVLGEERTFCVVPKEAKKVETGKPSPSKKRKTEMVGKEGKVGNKGTWVKCVNEKATAETGAHMAMFTPAQNPGYHAMSEKAKAQVVRWVDKAWYESPTPADAEEMEADASAGAGTEEEG